VFRVQGSGVQAPPPCGEGGEALVLREHLEASIRLSGAYRRRSYPSSCRGRAAAMVKRSKSEHAPLSLAGACGPLIHSPRPRKPITGLIPLQPSGVPQAPDSSCVLSFWPSGGGLECPAVCPCDEKG